MKQNLFHDRIKNTNQVKKIALISPNALIHMRLYAFDYINFKGYTLGPFLHSGRGNSHRHPSIKFSNIR